jgi:hypothetical protein
MRVRETVHVCVCVREREGGTERETERETDRQTQEQTERNPTPEPWQVQIEEAGEPERDR